MKTAFAVFVGSSLGLLAGDAFAGAKVSNLGVSVSLASRNADGVVSTARNSADSVQYIECSITARWEQNTPYLSVSCGARTAAGVTASCFTSYASAALVESLRMMAGDARVTFFWDTQGQCIDIRVKQSSQYAPKGQ